MTGKRYEVYTADDGRPGNQVGQPRDDPPDPPSPGTGRPQVLSAHGLARSYGRRRVLRDVTFTVPPGLLVGIEGENGSGKSTLLKCLVGLLRPGAGTVAVTGRIGYCPQEPALVDLLTCREQLLLLAAGYRLPAGPAAERIAELTQWFGCAGYLDERIDRLSGGTRQKINLIGALLGDPDVLVLDEPYQGFDYETYLTFWDYAERMRLDGRAVLVVSHMHAEKARFDAMLELRDGQVNASGPAAGQVTGGQQ